MMFSKKTKKPDVSRMPNIGNRGGHNLGRNIWGRTKDAAMASSAFLAAAVVTKVYTELHDDKNFGPVAEEVSRGSLYGAVGAAAMVGTTLLTERVLGTKRAEIVGATLITVGAGVKAALAIQGHELPFEHSVSAGEQMVDSMAAEAGMAVGLMVLNARDRGTNKYT